MTATVPIAAQITAGKHFDVWARLVQFGDLPRKNHHGTSGTCAFISIEEERKHYNKICVFKDLGFLFYLKPLRQIEQLFYD